MKHGEGRLSMSAKNGIWGFNVFLVLAELGSRTECSPAVEAKSALGTMTSNRNKEFRRGKR